MWPYQQIRQREFAANAPKKRKREKHDSLETHGWNTWMGRWSALYASILRGGAFPFASLRNGERLKVTRDLRDARNRFSRERRIIRDSRHYRLRSITGGGLSLRGNEGKGRKGEERRGKEKGESWERSFRVDYKFVIFKRFIFERSRFSSDFKLTRNKPRLRRNDLWKTNE